ncbi:hypothetical protein FRC06_000694, partial [Ceratobasidium sp. 370]
MRVFTKNQVADILRLYDIFPDQLNRIKPPKFPTAPVPFLPVHKGFMCPICVENDKPPFFWRSQNRATIHFTTEHSDCMWHEHDGISVELQSFSPADNLRCDFRVTSALISASQQTPAHGPPVSHAQLGKALISSWTTAQPPRPSPTVTLKEISPFALFSGWSHFMADKNPACTQAWVDLPDGGPLHRIVQSVQILFKTLGTQLPRIPIALRKQLTDEEGSGGSDALVELQSAQSQVRYSNAWAGVLTFVMRIWKKQQGGSGDVPTFPLTHNQRSWIKNAWGYAEKTPGHGSARDIILGLSAALWRPETTTHIMKDMFDEPVQQFVVFSNVQPDGSFEDPAAISSFLAWIKYIMRISTLFWVISKQDKDEFSTSWITTYIQQTLRASHISPFSSVYGSMGTAVRYPNAKGGVPKAMWAPDDYNTLLLAGEPCSLPLLRQQTAALLDEIDDGIASLLKGASPAQLGLVLNPNMVIVDNTSNTTTGYSFLTEDRNPFKDLKHALGIHILGNEDSSEIQSGLDANNHIVWREKGILDYLELHAKVTKDMALSWHLTGGQPSRGEESTTLQLHNAAHKFRSIVVVKGQLASLLTYNKIRTQIQADRAVAHAFPWVVLKQFLTMNVLVRPFASQLVGIKFGLERQYIQEQHVFSFFGQNITAEHLSQSLVAFFSRRLNCQKVGLNMHRHAVVKIQEHHMPAAAKTLAPVTAMTDAQAGHTSITAVGNYGLNAEERHMFLSNTLAKFVYVSTLWWPIVLPASHLTADELGRASLAPGKLSMPADTATPTSLSPSSINQVVQQTMGAFIPQIQDALARNQAQTLAQVQEMLRQAFPTTPPTSLNSGPELEIKHLALLKRWAGSQSASWKSPGQSKALSYILQAKERSLLCVLPTGGGKSFLFECLPMIEHGITVVFSPLVALRQSYRLQLARMPYQVYDWDPNHQPNEGLLLASIDDLNNPDFMPWAMQAKQNGTLNRFVVDEGHLAITQLFRPVMKELPMLVKVGVPLVVLSATVPPVHQAILQKAYGDPDWNVVRESTQRAEISYHIAKLQGPEAALVAIGAY